jgi:hypothetical protein
MLAAMHLHNMCLGGKHLAAALSTEMWEPLNAQHQAHQRRQCSCCRCCERHAASCCAIAMPVQLLLWFWMRISG